MATANCSAPSLVLLHRVAMAIQTPTVHGPGLHALSTTAEAATAQAVVVHVPLVLLHHHLVHPLPHHPAAVVDLVADVEETNINSSSHGLKTCDDFFSF